jgi:tetratricopeptide (TPR) repeat protein
MSYTGDRDYGKEFTCPYLAGRDFEDAIAKADTLLEKGEIESALLLLLNLEKKYVKAVRLFDLLRTAYLHLGCVEDGTRSESLYGALTDVFEKFGVEEKMTETVLQEDEDAEGMDTGEIDGPAAASLFPVTAAMGRELMRQGHFDRALEIFEALLVSNPGDETLEQCRDEAHKKSRETKMLEFLKGWLGAIEKIRSERSSSP